MTYSQLDPAGFITLCLQQGLDMFQLDNFKTFVASRTVPTNPFDFMLDVGAAISEFYAQ